MIELGSPLPAFRLPAPDGREVASDDFAREYQDQGLGVVGIDSNDSQALPADSPERMREESQARGYPFPYLVDETQQVARAFQAACTPDLFLFDRDHRLAYRGQFDDSRPSKETPVTGNDLRAAADAVLQDQAPDPHQKPSMGCSIKWRE